MGFYLSGILSLSQAQSSASLVYPVRRHHYFHHSVAKAGLLFATVAFGCGSTVFMLGHPERHGQSRICVHSPTLSPWTSAMKLEF